MYVPRFRNKLDLLVALVILIGASGASIFFYTDIRSIEAAPAPVLSFIGEGKHRFAVIKDGLCVGEFSSELERAPVPVVTAGAGLRASYGKYLTQAGFSSRASFNPLGQLVESFSTLSGAGISATAHTLNSDPIQVEMRIEMAGERYRYQVEIPGPLMLQRNPDSSYRLLYGHLPGAGNLVSSLIYGLSRHFELREHEIGSNQPACPDDLAGSIDLTPAINLLDGRIKKLEKIVEG
jgi:hypothetical protein